LVRLVDPLGDESLESYAKRLSEHIPKNDEVVLIGVSFGGIIVQEIHKLVNTKKVIIISSVKHCKRLGYSNPNYQYSEQLKLIF